MRLEEYRRRQDLLTVGVINLVMRLLRAVGTRPLNQAQFDTLVDVLMPAVQQARARGFELARLMYADDAPGPVPDVPEPHYERGALASALERTARVRLAGIEKLEMPAAVARANVAATTAAAAVARHVEMAGRDTIVATSRADPKALGWARVATGRETCAFCLMVISRGFEDFRVARKVGLRLDEREAVEATRFVAEAVRNAAPDADTTAILEELDTESLRALMKKWHDGCDCIAVPVFHEASWPGRAQFIEAEQLWKDTTGRASGKGKLNAFRRAVEGRASA